LNHFSALFCPKYCPLAVNIFMKKDLVHPKNDLRFENAQGLDICFDEPNHSNF